MLTSYVTINIFRDSPVLRVVTRNCYRLLALGSLANLAPTLTALQEINASFGGYYLTLHLLTFPLFFIVAKRAGLLLLERILIVAANLLMIAVYLAIAAPFYLPLSKVELDTSLPKFKVLYANVRYDADASDLRLNQMIQRYQPDIVALLEFTPARQQILKLSETYEYRKEIPLNDAFGLGFYSKFPFQEIARERYESLPEAFNAQVKIGGNTILLDLVHALPPRTNEAWYLNKLVLRRLATPYRDAPAGNFLLLADLNATPFSRFAKYYLKGSSMFSASFGHGMPRTWQADSWFAYLTIDHIFYRGKIIATDFKVLPAFGSDHYPLLAEFAFTKKDSRAEMRDESL